MADGLGESWDGVQAPMAQTTSGMLAAVDGMQQVGQQAMVLGAAMTGVGVAIVGGFVAGLMTLDDAADRVDDSLAKVASVVTPLSGTVEDASKRMKAAALDWSKAHTQSATDFLDTTYMMISAGLDEVAAVEATRSAMLVATATMGDGASAAALLATIYNNMGDKTKDAAVELAHLGDVVTKTQQTFQFANLDQLNEGLKFGIPTALQFGIGIEELSTIIGQFNNAGLQGSMAGTAFSASMAQMQKASEKLGFAIARNAEGGVDFIGTIKNIENQFGSLADMSPEVMASFQQAFGGEGWRGLSLMIGKSAELEANLGKVRDNANAAAGAAKVIESAGSSLDQILMNNIEAFKVEFADKLAPGFSAFQESVAQTGAALMDWLKANPEVIDTIASALNDLMKAVAGFVPRVLEAVQAVGGWIKENPELVKTIIKVVAAIGAVLAIVGPVVAGIGAFIAAVAAIAAPFLFIVASVVSGWALVAGVVFVAVKAWDWAKGKALAVWNAIGGVVSSAWGTIKQALSGVTSAVMGIWNGVTEHLAGAWRDTVAAFRQNFFLGLFQVFKNFTPVGWLAQAWGKVISALPTIWSTITTSVSTAWEGVKALLAQKWQEVVDGFKSGFIDGFAALFLNFTPAGWITQGLMALGQVVTELMTPVVDWVLGRFSAIGAWAITSWNSIVAALPGVWAAIQAAVQAGIDALLAVFSYFSPVPIFQQAWDALLGWFGSLSLAESGTALLQTLAQGIQAATGLPVEALKGVVTKLRNMLPFSPAKEGPLRDLDKIRLVETIASTVRAQPLVTALSGATVAATQATAAAARYNPIALPDVAVPAGISPGITVPRVPVPEVQPLRVAAPFEPGGRDGGSFAGLPPQLNITIPIAGNATPETVDRLDQWARENALMLYELVQRAASREARGAF